MNHLFRAEQGKMIFSSETAKVLFQEDLKKNEGKQYRIEKVKKPVSDELRAYYFSAVIPIIRSTCDSWQKLTGEEVHEVIKKMLFYFETFNPQTQRTERFGRSVMKRDDWNNTAKATQFLDIVGQYLSDCGLEMPSAEDFKRYKDSAPLLNNN